MKTGVFSVYLLVQDCSTLGKGPELSQEPSRVCYHGIRFQRKSAGNSLNVTASEYYCYSRNKETALLHASWHAFSKPFQTGGSKLSVFGELLVCLLPSCAPWWGLGQDNWFSRHVS